MRRLIKIVLVFGFAAITAQPAAAQQRATPITSWITDADLPPDLAEKQRDGSARVRFTVTAEGRATECKVQYATVSAHIRTRICELIQERARYIPAYARSGDPIESKDELVISWRSGKPIVGESDFGGALPANDQSKWITANDIWPTMLSNRKARIDIHLAFRIGTDGRVSDCSGSSPAWPDGVATACKRLTTRARFKPPVGRDGNALETSAKLVITWTTLG